MSTTPKTPQLEISEDFKKQLDTIVNSDDIRAAMVAEAQRQGFGGEKLVYDSDGRLIGTRDLAAEDAKAAEAKAAEEKAAADKVAAEKAVADAEAAKKAAAAPQIYERDIVVAGETIHVTAKSAEDLSDAIINAYELAARIQAQHDEDEGVPVPTAEEIAAQKVADEKRAAELAELDIQFKQGTISAKDYLEKSGALEEVFEQQLAAQGLSVEDIRAAVEERKVQTEISGWQEAGQKFLANSDWPGGENNEARLKFVLANMNLEPGMSIDEKVAAYQQAYASLREQKLLEPFTLKNLTPQQRDVFLADHPDYYTQHPEDKPTETVDPAAKAAADAAAKAAEQKAAADAAAAEAAKKLPRTSSSVFGASSGTSDNDQKTPAAGNDKVDLKALGLKDDASPQEIVEAWKRQVLTGGQNPNDVFMEGFRGRR
jgi:hypothetical protein